jgi:uncharacterized protein (DUF433 family)
MLPTTLPITHVDLSDYIETRIFGERPHIRNRRVPVATVAYHAKVHAWDVARLAEEFFLSREEVLAALSYYEAHHELIDLQEAAYQRELDEAFEQSTA